MNSKAPARTGNLPCRLAPRHPAALLALTLALLLAGCAAGLTGPDPGRPDLLSGSSGRPAATVQKSAGDGPGTQAEDPDPQQAEADQVGHAADDTGPIPEVELSSQLMFQILASEVAAQRGELASAATTYLSIARQTRDSRLARRATEIALTERSLDRALPAARLWHELAPASRLAAQSYEMLLISAGRFEEAEPLLSARLAGARADGTLAQAYAALQRMLGRTAEHAAAFAMLERLASADRGVPQARLALAAQAAAAGDNSRAAREAKAAAGLAPDDESIAVAAAQHIAEAEARPDSAIALLAPFVARRPDALEARFALARMLASAERNAEAQAHFEEALRQQPHNPMILFSLAQLAWQAKQPAVAERYLKRYIDLPESVQRNDNPAWLFLGQIAETGGLPEEAIARYEKVGRGEQFMPALIRRALLLGKQGSIDEARRLLAGTAVSTNRDRVQLISAEAQVLREARRHDEALALLSRSLERLPENPELLYDHAMAAERVDRLDLMEASLRKLIALRPDHAHAYNALGYTFADRNIRLDEAQQLIAKALELRPGDAHILDSMGWVRYRRGDLSGALDHLRRAWQASPEAEIAVHLGEVLWRTGEREEALRVWREARKLEPENETLRATLNRLGARL